MKHILCYGDSNTWGSRAYDGRYEDDKQWPNLLQQRLGSDFKVIQEGLCGRFAGEVEVSEQAFKNGQAPFEAIYRSATPVHVLVVALGTNDLKSKYKRTAEQIYQDIMWYAAKAKELDVTNEGESVQILFVAPGNFVPKEDYFYAEESLHEELLELFMECEHPVVMINDLQLTEDGVHYTEQDHQTVAQAVFTALKEEVL